MNESISEGIKEGLDSVSAICVVHAFDKVNMFMRLKANYGENLVRTW